MVNIVIDPITNNNGKEIYEFESNNKEYFESVLPPRPEGYYNLDEFNIIMRELIKECEAGDCYMHIIRETTSQKVIGRINLTMINTDHPRKAELGYRISKDECGKGVASEAVAIIKELCRTDYNIKVLEAGTSTENIGSQKVLEKNGFIFLGEEKNVMKINGRWVDGALYECHLD